MTGYLFNTYEDMYRTEKICIWYVDMYRTENFKAARDKKHSMWKGHTAFTLLGSTKELHGE